jgi:hypothetical protein
MHDLNIDNRSLVASEDVRHKSGVWGMRSNIILDFNDQVDC